MKKSFILLGSVLLAGCFICHKTNSQEEISAEQGIVEQQSPAPKEVVITRYTISEAANFAFDSKTIRVDANKIDEVMKDIQAHPNAIVLLEGHTDNIGRDEYNQNLSVQRANSVAEELIKRGVSARRIRVSGAGSTKPIASNDTKEGRAHNRRVDMELVNN